MNRYPCLVFDANIVIYLFRLGLWQAVVSRVELVLAQTVVDEAKFYVDEADEERAIDLETDIAAGRIRVVAVAASEMAAFRAKFDPVYMRKLDDGETESLAFCLRAGPPYRLCSADAIVFKVLAMLDCDEQDVSLEELLREIGLARTLPERFGRAFRLRNRAAGIGDRFAGIGLKSSWRE